MLLEFCHRDSLERRRYTDWCFVVSGHGAWQAQRLLHGLDCSSGVLSHPVVIPPTLISEYLNSAVLRSANAVGTPSAIPG